MISAIELDPTLQEVAKALGLLDGAGNLDGSWFQDPTQKLRQMLTSADQRAALLQFLGAQFPSAPPAGALAGERWHPLLGALRRGNVYVTVGTSADPVIGLAGELTSEGSPASVIRVQVPLVKVQGATLQPVSGTSGAPVSLRLRVGLDWTRPAQAIGLQAVVVSLLLAGDGVSATVLLEQLDLDGAGARDTVLDPAKLGPDALRVITGLTRQNLASVTTGDEALSVKDHLLALLGFGDDGIASFPFGGDAAAIQAWFRALVPLDGPPPMLSWLVHLAGVAGSKGITVAGSGTLADPWTVPLLGFPEISALAAVTASAGSRSLLLGVRTRAVPGDPNPAARLEADAYVTAMPLDGGATSAAVLPLASLCTRAPGGAGAQPLVDTAAIRARSLRAGAQWTVNQLRPVLELEDVTFGGKHHDRIDLTDADSLVAAAGATIIPLILAALGNGAGRSLAVLAGLLPPSRDASSPNTADPGTLASQPTRAMAAFHRRVLLDPVHHWGFLLGEVADLLGVAGGAAGAGTADDPWRFQLGPASGLPLQLAAWNDPAAGGAQRLRLGLRTAVAAGPLRFWWLAELLGFDLPVGEAAAVSFFGGHHAALVIEPALEFEILPERTLAAESSEIRMDWAPGQQIEWRGLVRNLRLTGEGGALTVAELRFPAPGGFDVGNPAATAAALGIAPDGLESLLKALLASAAQRWAAMPGHVVAALCGLHGFLPDLPADWPLLSDPAGPGSLLSDPVAAMRAHGRRLAAAVSSDGTPFLLPAMRWAAALLGDVLPPTPAQAAGGFDALVEGCGRPDDPWRLSSGALQGRLWMEPDGPPQAWPTGLAARLGAATTWAELLHAARDLALVVPTVRDALSGRDPDALAASLEGFANYLAHSDGIVTTASQLPEGDRWAAGAPLNVRHGRQPGDAGAIEQILAQVDAWAGGSAGARSVLLLGPPFSDHAVWDALLASPDRHGATDAGAHFGLRIPGVDPVTIDLGMVTAVADYYTADLAGDDLAALQAQLGRVVERIQQLKPGVSVTLVAHSTAGVVARAFTAASPAKVQGLITLGAPLLGASLEFAIDPGTTDAVRFLDAVMDAPDLLRDIVHVLDGYTPAAKPGELPPLFALPLGLLAPNDEVDTGGRPALALGGPLAGDLLAAGKAALVALAAREAVAVRAAPTHLAFGVGASLGQVATGASDYVVESTLAMGLARLAIQDAAPEPPHATNAITVEIELSRDGGWLAGGPSALISTPVDARVRALRLALDLLPDGAQPQATPRARFIELAFHGPTAPAAGLQDAAALPVLGTVFHEIARASPPTGALIGQLLAALRSLDLLVPDPQGSVGFSADAFTALTTKGAAVPFLAPRLWTALASPSGLAGFAAAGGGSWKLAIGGTTVDLAVARNPTRIELRTREGEI